MVMRDGRREGRKREGDGFGNVGKVERGELFGEDLCVWVYV